MHHSDSKALFTFSGPFSDLTLTFVVLHKFSQHFLQFHFKLSFQSRQCHFSLINLLHNKPDSILFISSQNTQCHFLYFHSLSYFMSRHLIGQLLGNSKQRHRKPSKGNNSIHFHVRTRRNLKQMKYFTIHVSDLEIRAWLHFRYISLKFLQTSHMLVHVRHAIFIFKKYIIIIFIIKAMIK